MCNRVLPQRWRGCCVPLSGAAVFRSVILRTKMRMSGTGMPQARSPQSLLLSHGNSPGDRGLTEPQGWKCCRLQGPVCFGGQSSGCHVLACSHVPVPSHNSDVSLRAIYLESNPWPAPSADTQLVLINPITGLYLLQGTTSLTSFCAAISAPLFLELFLLQNLRTKGTEIKSVS